MLLCKMVAATCPGLTTAEPVGHLKSLFRKKVAHETPIGNRPQLFFNQFKVEHSAPQFYNTCLCFVSRAAMADVFATNTSRSNAVKVQAAN